MTRIIAGQYRGRRLHVPTGIDVRPTTDRMRERVFSMLLHPRYPDMTGARVLDLFAGTGALGFECLSRGAGHATFVENAPKSLACLQKNITSLNVEGQSHILRTHAQALPVCEHPYDFIFMDPPYRVGLIEPTLESLVRGHWISHKGVIICELAHDDDTAFQRSLTLIDERSQGQQRVVFLMQK